MIPSPRSVEVSSNEVAPNPTPSRKVSMVARATVKTGVSRVDTQASAVMKIPSPLLKAIPQAAPAEIPAHSFIASRPAEVNSMASLTQNAPVEMGGAAFATGSEDLTGATTAELPIVTSAPISKELSSADQKKLANDLLNFQFIAQNAKREALLASNVAVAPSRNSIPIPDTRENTIQNEQNADEPILENGSRKNQINGKQAGTTAECDILPNHEFIRPINSGTGETNNQICPTHKKWISKNKNNSGWVKVEGSNHLATLTLTPAPSQGSTLLIDENGLALLALKSGIHITKGMGIIIGTAPEGYKVEFTGRAEETEYFETNGHSYFAILNVEPGAGVVELESKTNQNLNSTVFTPILEDTVTYLDLVTPVLQDLPIKVVKSGKENDPEVMNLTVGLSTQSGIQAITQADGKAILKNANLVPGYPVFIDVSSRSGINQSYTYRYQLKQRKKSGFFVVNEISEKSISGWLAQVKQGLSDQGAMVVGFYDRKTLDGFKNHYFTKVEPLTSKFGLEPLNYSLLWDGSISNTEPLEGDAPRFMSVQVAEGLSQVQLLDETQKPVQMELLPISPRVIHVISE
ncbi:MAG: hypothetical protein H7333_07120 [Bdellovibrionales bacterium]|nr:hypothetical protein [Oligoflexia bacterium]